MGPHPAVAACRRAVREQLADLEPGAVVLVACSGGADSLALATATAFEAPGAGVFAGAVTVDHGLQAGSDQHAKKLAERLRTLGLDPVEIATVTVTDSEPGGVGPEAAARRARYAALASAAGRAGAQAVLLGHTRDDQAETVLLGLARGSGARSLAGMAPVSGLYRRPFLQLDRETCRLACEMLGEQPWDDPHNLDPAYTRVRVRHQVLPVLERELGPGVAAALARTADQLRSDAVALDAWADEGYSRALTEQGLRARDLVELPEAIRRRVLRRAALEAGCPGTDLFAVHIAGIDALVVNWHGQAGVDLPGGIRAFRREGCIWFRPVTVGP
ncbi:tRNA lysidine(34) synthetase [Flindersiella endophytica]